MRNLLCLISLIFLFGCNGPTIVHEDQMQLDESWSYSQPFSTELDVTDTEALFDLAVEIKHSTHFGFENLYLLIGTEFPDGKFIEEPISLELADKKGNWQSKCRGENCQLEFFLQEKFKFKQSGKYKFTIGQYSRKEELEGILAIGFKLMASTTD